MTNKTKLFSAILLVFLSGCMSISEVAKIDRDTYVVSSSTRARVIDNQKLLLASAEKATEFCDKQDLDMIRADGLLSHKGFGDREMMFNFQCVERAG